MPNNAGSHPRIATNYGAVTPSNTVNFPDEVAGVRVGGVGDVVLVKRDGTLVTIVAAQVGEYIDFACIRVHATNTTATNLVWYV